MSTLCRLPLHPSKATPSLTCTSVSHDFTCTHLNFGSGTSERFHSHCSLVCAVHNFSPERKKKRLKKWKKERADATPLILQYSFISYWLFLISSSITIHVSSFVGCVGLTGDRVGTTKSKRRGGGRCRRRAHLPWLLLSACPSDPSVCLSVTLSFPGQCISWLVLDVILMSWLVLVEFYTAMMGMLLHTTSVIVVQQTTALGSFMILLYSMVVASLF